MFVNVRFIKEDPSDGSYFVAGKKRTDNSNRILGFVRTSPSRTKADFDKLALRMEEAWYDAVGVPRTDGDILYPSGAGDKRLLAVGFLPIVTAREAGLAIPEAGKEAEWFREKLPLMKRVAEREGGEFAEMLKELGEREDLRKLMN